MGTQLPLKGHSPPPIFGPCLLCPINWMDQDTTWYGSRLRSRRHCVRWGTQLPHKKGSPSTVRPMSIVAKRSPISATADHLLNITLETVLKSVDFWATVCKTVRPMLPDRCLSVCLSVSLYVTLVCCGQRVRWIKMKLVTQVGLGPGHIVSDRDQLPLPKGAQPLHFPNFRPMFAVAKRLNGPRYHLVGR